MDRAIRTSRREPSVEANARFPKATTTSALYEQLLAVEPGQLLIVRDTLLSGLVLPIWVTDAPSALLEAFATSGHVAQLGNPELRQQLLGWVPLLEDLRDDEARLRAFQDSEVRPYLSSAVDLAIAWPALVGWMRRGQDVPGLILPDYDAVQHDVELVATLELRNLVAQTETLLVAPLIQSPQALEVLQGLADTIRAELP